MLGRRGEKSGLPSRCKDAVSRLTKLNINFLALDFDYTILDVHTGGRFKGSIEELCSHVRPMFIHLISAAHAAGIKIAVVTFSPQTQFIAEVLENFFPFASEIIIRGRDQSWSYEGNGMKDGKQAHMASAVEELMTNDDTLNITRSSTLLVDDDDSNIKLALREGVRAILLDPHNSSSLLTDMTILV